LRCEGGSARPGVPQHGRTVLIISTAPA
jgi:hypothetical protein